MNEWMNKTNLKSGAMICLIKESAKGYSNIDELSSVKKAKCINKYRMNGAINERGYSMS